MKIWVDTADLNEIAEWAEHPWVSGFTTNPTLMRAADPDASHTGGVAPGGFTTMKWAEAVVKAARGKPISIDGPPEVWELGPNVYRKVVDYPYFFDSTRPRLNLTAICNASQIPRDGAHPQDVISVFAGRILDTGRSPQPVIDAAKQTGAQVLWASVREPYNITMAEQMGCDIITVPPVILRKYLEWNAMPLETVAELTIAQFDKDREGLWT